MQTENINLLVKEADIISASFYIYIFIYGLFDIYLIWDYNKLNKFVFS